MKWTACLRGGKLSEATGDGTQDRQTEACIIGSMKHGLHSHLGRWPGLLERMGLWPENTEKSLSRRSVGLGFSGLTTSSSSMNSCWIGLWVAVVRELNLIS